MGAAWGIPGLLGCCLPGLMVTSAGSSGQEGMKSSRCARGVLPASHQLPPCLSVPGTLLGYQPLPAPPQPPQQTLTPDPH